MKRILIGLMALACAGLATPAFAICTNTAITSTGTSTKIVASVPIRRQLALYAGGACPLWCDIGATPTVGSGFFVAPNEFGAAGFIPPVQFPSNTFPLVPTGQVNCLLPANEGCSTSSATVCQQ